MSYDIYIGNAKLEYLKGEDYIYPVIEQVEHPDAPIDPSVKGWNDISVKTNGRHPGYMQMMSWAQRVGLSKVWFDKETGLLRDHPGIRELTRDHLDAHLEAHKKYPDDFCLSWYIFWMKWALENCQFPAVYNC